MTCIAGVAQARSVEDSAESIVTIGGDRALSSQWNLTICGPKVFPVMLGGAEHDMMIIGCAGSVRMSNLLHFSFEPPACPPGRDPERYIVGIFMDSVRTLFRQAGAATISNIKETGNSFLVGYRGHLYRVETDYQTSEEISDCNAIGTGAEVAIGALHVLHKTQLTRTAPRYAVLAALEAAERWNNGVRAPFDILTLRADGRVMRADQTTLHGAPETARLRGGADTEIDTEIEKEIAHATHPQETEG